MIRIAVAGALGRTGRYVLECAARDARFMLPIALVEKGHPRVGCAIDVDGQPITLIDHLGEPVDVLIDFTTPSGTMLWLEQCLHWQMPLVTGTTGLSAAQQDRVLAGSHEIPLLQASNFSVGIHELVRLVQEAAAKLGADFDIEILEAHHRHKADAPSGTARTLLQAVCAATGRKEDGTVVHGRSGQTGARPRSQIGMHALRLGGVVGHHEVHFGSEGETLTLTHTAHSRKAFADGAVRAAAWIVKGKGPGLYAMRDVIEAGG